MAMSWVANVKDAGRLTVFNGLTAQWGTVFKRALDSFNQLAGGLGVKLEQTKDKAQANIVMQLSGGAAKFEYDGNVATATFDGTAAHGKTLLFSRDNLIEKAASFLPVKPRESHIDVLTFITVHELIHACGLDNRDHANDGVFMTLPNIRGGRIWASADSRKMPPLFLHSSTIVKIKTVWG
jgi:hypothetical protein